MSDIMFSRFFGKEEPVEVKEAVHAKFTGAVTLSRKLDAKIVDGDLSRLPVIIYQDEKFESIDDLRAKNPELAGFLEKRLHQWAIAKEWLFPKQMLALVNPLFNSPEPPTLKNSPKSKSSIEVETYTENDENKVRIKYVGNFNYLETPESPAQTVYYKAEITIPYHSLESDDTEDRTLNFQFTGKPNVIASLAENYANVIEALKNSNHDAFLRSSHITNGFDLGCEITRNYAATHSIPKSKTNQQEQRLKKLLQSAPFNYQNNEIEKVTSKGNTHLYKSLSDNQLFCISELDHVEQDDQVSINYDIEHTTTLSSDDLNRNLRSIAHSTTTTPK